MGRFPDTTVESPWSGPKPVLHLSLGNRAEPSYDRKLKAQIKDRSNTHVVREVRTGFLRDHLVRRSWTAIAAYSRTFLEDCIERAEAQYEQLETYGIAVPDHEFAITSDNLGRDRVLARIAIIEGRSCAPRSDLPLSQLACRVGIGFAPAAIQEALKLHLTDYQDDHNTYQRLADISTYGLNDFVHGIPRAQKSESVDNQTYLVDLEPLFISTDKK